MGRLRGRLERPCTRPIPSSSPIGNGRGNEPLFWFGHGDVPRTVLCVIRLHVLMTQTSLVRLINNERHQDRLSKHFGQATGSKFQFGMDARHWDALGTPNVNFGCRKSTAMKLGSQIKPIAALCQWLL